MTTENFEQIIKAIEEVSPIIEKAYDDKLSKKERIEAKNKAIRLLKTKIKETVENFLNTFYNQLKQEGKELTADNFLGLFIPYFKIPNLLFDKKIISKIQEVQGFLKEIQDHNSESVIISATGNDLRLDLTNLEAGLIQNIQYHLYNKHKDNISEGLKQYTKSEIKSLSAPKLELNTPLSNFIEALNFLSETRSDIDIEFATLLRKLGVQLKLSEKYPDVFQFLNALLLRNGHLKIVYFEGEEDSDIDNNFINQIKTKNEVNDKLDLHKNTDEKVKERVERIKTRDENSVFLQVKFPKKDYSDTISIGEIDTVLDKNENTIKLSQAITGYLKNYINQSGIFYLGSQLKLYLNEIELKAKLFSSLFPLGTITEENIKVEIIDEDTILIHFIHEISGKVDEAGAKKLIGKTEYTVQVKNTQQSDDIKDLTVTLETYGTKIVDKQFLNAFLNNELYPLNEKELRKKLELPMKEPSEQEKKKLALYSLDPYATKIENNKIVSRRKPNYIPEKLTNVELQNKINHVLNNPFAIDTKIYFITELMNTPVNKDIIREVLSIGNPEEKHFYIGFWLVLNQKVAFKDFWNTYKGSDKGDEIEIKREMLKLASENINCPTALQEDLIELLLQENNTDITNALISLKPKQRNKILNLLMEQIEKFPGLIEALVKFSNLPKGMEILDNFLSHYFTQIKNEKTIINKDQANKLYDLAEALDLPSKHPKLARKLEEALLEQGYIRVLNVSLVNSATKNDIKEEKELSIDDENYFLQLVINTGFMVTIDQQDKLNDKEKASLKKYAKDELDGHKNFKLFAKEKDGEIKEIKSFNIKQRHELKKASSQEENSDKHEKRASLQTDERTSSSDASSPMTEEMSKPNTRSNSEELVAQLQERSVSPLLIEYLQDQFGQQGLLLFNSVGISFITNKAPNITSEFTSNYGLIKVFYDHRIYIQDKDTIIVDSTIANKTEDGKNSLVTTSCRFKIKVKNNTLEVKLSDHMCQIGDKALENFKKEYTPVLNNKYPSTKKNAKLETPSKQKSTSPLLASAKVFSINDDQEDTHLFKTVKEKGTNLKTVVSKTKQLFSTIIDALKNLSDKLPRMGSRSTFMKL